MRGRFAWLYSNTSSRFLGPEDLVEGDIVMKLADGRLFLVGTDGNLRRPSPWDHVREWIRRVI